VLEAGSWELCCSLKMKLELLELPELLELAIRESTYAVNLVGFSEPTSADWMFHESRRGRIIGNWIFNVE